MVLHYSELIILEFGLLVEQTKTFDDVILCSTGYCDGHFSLLSDVL